MPLVVAILHYPFYSEEFPTCHHKVHQCKQLLGLIHYWFTQRRGVQAWRQKRPTSITASWGKRKSSV